MMTYNNTPTTGSAGRRGRLERLKDRNGACAIDVKLSEIPEVKSENVDMTNLAVLKEAFQCVDAVILSPRIISPEVCFCVDT